MQTPTSETRDEVYVMLEKDKKLDPRAATSNGTSHAAGGPAMPLLTLDQFACIKSVRIDAGSPFRRSSRSDTLISLEVPPS